jgi:hypothetical protein
MGAQESLGDIVATAVEVQRGSQSAREVAMGLDIAKAGLPRPLGARAEFLLLCERRSGQRNEKYYDD